MNHSAKFPLKTQNKFFFFARNPEDENDATWFRHEEDAFSHFCDFGKHYSYTAINEAEGTSEFLNDEFEERRDNTAENRAASYADAFQQFCREREGVA